MLHGATGTGKTAALASLAYRLALHRTYPVIFVDRRTERFDRSAVDRFSQWAEDFGAAATVVIWDGMRGVNDTNALHVTLPAVAEGSSCSAVVTESLII